MAIKINGNRYSGNDGNRIVIVQGPKSNINGRELTSFSATLSTNGGYTVYTITDNNNNGNMPTAARAADYMSYMCGDNFVPTYDQEFPKKCYLCYARYDILEGTV